MKQQIKLDESKLKSIIGKSIKKVLKEYDEGNYYGGGLPDKYFDEEEPQTYDENEPENGECVYIVFDRNEEIVCVCKSKESAMRKSDENVDYYFSQYRIIE